MNVHLHIEHLVLDGLPVEPDGGDLVRAAVEAELTRLLAEGTLGPGLRTGGAHFAVPADDVAFSHSDSANTLGGKIGQAIYGGISR
jgi:hypothetical protein